MTQSENTAMNMGAKYAEAQYCLKSAISDLKQITHCNRLPALDIAELRKVIDFLEAQVTNVSTWEASKAFNDYENTK